MQFLIEDYFLVPIDFEENKTVHELRALIKQLFARKRINNYLILTTTNCNARCAYCFEEGIRRINMSVSTADKITDYIFNQSDKETVKLHWFGGEPLVCANRIDQICKGLTEKNVDYISFMTSNGYLLSEGMIQRASNIWNLRRIQITLDGTEEVYNKVKNYVFADNNPFKRVMDNIGLLLDANIQVVLRLNLDYHNAEDLQVLVQNLNALFGHMDNLTIYPSRIIDEICDPPFYIQNQNSDLEFQLMHLKDSILKLGFQMPARKLLSLKTNSCMADNDETIVIHPDGSLSKCESVREKNIIGHIDMNDVINTKTDSFKDTFEFDYCKNCCLYPACILLKACPTKQSENPEMCKRSIIQYCKELEEHYKKNKWINTLDNF